MAHIDRFLGFLFPLFDAKTSQIDFEYDWGGPRSLEVSGLRIFVLASYDVEGLKMGNISAKKGPRPRPVSRTHVSE